MKVTETVPQISGEVTITLSSDEAKRLISAMKLVWNHSSSPGSGMLIPHPTVGPYAEIYTALRDICGYL